MVLEDLVPKISHSLGKVLHVQPMVRQQPVGCRAYRKRQVCGWAPVTRYHGIAAITEEFAALEEGASGNYFLMSWHRRQVGSGLMFLD